MSDDFGTVNVQRGARSREIEVIRQHYRRHRESLTGMITDAPTEHLANEYRRLIGDIDASLVKLDELDRGSGAMPAMTADTALPTPVAPGPAPGMRPLVATYAPPEELPQHTAEPRSRLPLIIIVTLLALGAIGWLIWRASSKDAPAAGTVVEETTTQASTAPATETGTIETPPAAPAALTVAPASHDYGVIHKGTRATRQFEVTNHTDQPITMVVGRSSCKCLFYEYQALIAPKGKESVTVTVDGARAKAGELRETVRVTSKSDPSVGTSFDVIAVIR